MAQLGRGQPVNVTGGTGRGPGITAGAESPSLTITGRSTSGPTMTGG